MSSTHSRHLFTFATASLVLTVGIGRTAVAKPCTADSDCGAGYQCNLAPTKGGSSGEGGSAGTSTPGFAPPDVVPRSIDAGVVTKTPVLDGGDSTSVPSTGTCAPKPIVCASTADCPADFECEKAWSTAPCRAGDPNCGSESQPSETGTCRAVPRACSTAADCPAPLVCQSRGGTCTGGAEVGPNGEIITMPEVCTPGTSVCTFTPTVCKDDSVCADSWQCVKVGQGSQCSGSSGTCTRTETGTSCTPTEPPVCTTYDVMNCVPKQIPCVAGQACPSGWSCFDMSSLDEVLPGWTANENPMACLPDGLILAAQGHAAGGGGSDSIGSSDGDKGTVSLRGDAGLTGAAEVGGWTSSGPENALPPSAIPSGLDAGAAAGDLPVVAKDDGCGCSLGAAASPSTSPWLMLGLAGLALRVARRRR